MNTSTEISVAATENDYDRMRSMLVGHWIIQMIHGLARYSFADYLSNRPHTADEIAQTENLDRNATFRFLRACASVGLVAYEGDSRFGSTPLLETLRKDNPHSLRGLALTFPAPGHWLPWGRFTEALKTGERQTIPALGSDLFEYYARNLAERAAFTEAMHGLGVASAQEAAKVIDTSNVVCAVDVGGADGTLLFALLETNPALQGIIFELPTVIPSATSAIERAGFQTRATTVAGDFFTSIPPADLYLIRAVLHNWDDDACIRILNSCKQSILPTGRVVIIEHLLDEVGKPGMAPLMDLNMMVLSPGRERTIAEYERLLDSAGFSTSRCISGTSLMVLEAE